MNFEKARFTHVANFKIPLMIYGLLGVWLTFTGIASAALVVSTTNQLGAVPLTPSWTAASDSLITGLTPTTAVGNFGEYTSANANNLTKPGIPLTVYAYSSPQATNLEVCGNDGTAGSLLVYTLPASSYGFDLTNITVYGGWQDGGRDAQDYTVYYSTMASPGLFIMLTNVSFNPSNPTSTGCANRVTISDSVGTAIARNVVALKFDFTTPPAENGACGYTAITVKGSASTNAVSSPFAITASNQHSDNSFTPSWPIETDSIIAEQMPVVGPGNFLNEAGMTGVSALTDGTFGPVDNKASYATCGSLAGQSVTYFLGAAMITNIVVYSGWPNTNRDGQFFNIYYSTVSAPTMMIPLTEVNYNPAVTGMSANRVAITTTNGLPLATNVALLEFDFTPQTSNSDNGYSGYAEIIVEGTNGTPVAPIFGASPIAEPYPYVLSDGLTGPAVPLSPDPLVAYRWPNPQASDDLQIYLQKPVAVSADTNSSFANLQSLLTTNPDVTVSGTGSILMDFKQENAAWLEFDSPDLPNPSQVTMSISEYNQPALDAPTLSPVKYGNSYRLEINNKVDYEGVRFGWIHVNSFTTPWHITGVRVVCQTKPANYNGSFSCSDDMLTRIWYVGAYDVKLNLEQDYIGAILMDRGDRIPWTGDDHCSQAAALAAFADYDFIKANINLTANNYNGIASYALYWVLSLLDYYNYTGDSAFLTANISTAQAVLDNAYSVYGTNPNLSFYGWDQRLGAGFENANCPEAEKAYQMLSIETWSRFAVAMGTIGRTDLQSQYSGYATAKMAALRQNSTWFLSYGLHAGADAVNTGLLNPTEKNAIFTQQFQDRVNRVSFSGFNQYFVIQAFAGMDKYDDALNSIEDLWGGEIKYGGTTFFEVSRPSWNDALGINDPIPDCQAGITSLCHPWSAGVTKWLSEEILGIKPTSPGFVTYQILPHLGSTLTYVQGTMPTPQGGIQASFNVSNGLCSVTSPVGTVGTIGVPKVGKTITSITINHTLAWDGGYHNVSGVGGAYADSEFVYFTNVQAGAYSMAVTYSGSTPVYTPPPMQYAAKFVKTDTNTSGNWGGVYGKDGYVLLNYNGVGNNVQSLPAYVASVNNYNSANNVWVNGTNDSRALAPNSSNTGARTAACIYGGQYLDLNINLAGTRNYQVTLYFVDWDNKGRQMAVEMFDAQTLDLVAPVKVLTNSSGGVYLVYVYNRSAKFQVNHIRGDNAVLSGVFFDPAPVGLQSVYNPSFEVDAATPGAQVNQVPTGWTSYNQANTGDIGSANGIGYSVTNPLAPPADQNQYGFVNMFQNGVTGGIYQDIGTLQPNTTYQLTVAIGSRGDRVNSPGIISLINGTNNNGTVLASGGGLPATQDTWQNYTVPFTTGPSVGGDLTVALSVAGNSSTIQADFDNVRLTETPVSAEVPTIAPPQLAQGNLVLTGAGGVPNGSYTWLTATNLSAPVSWITNSIGLFDITGAFSNVLVMNPLSPVTFYRMRVP